MLINSLVQYIFTSSVYSWVQNPCLAWDSNPAWPPKKYPGPKCPCVSNLFKTRSCWKHHKLNYQNNINTLHSMTKSSVILCCDGSTTHALIGWYSDAVLQWLESKFWLWIHKGELSTDSIYNTVHIYNTVKISPIYNDWLIDWWWWWWWTNCL